MTLKKSIQIRPLRVHDLAGIKNIIELNQMFPVEMLDEMTATCLAGDDVEEFWCVATDEQDNPICVTYCAPEYMTKGTRSDGNKAGCYLWKHPDCLTLLKPGYFIPSADIPGLLSSLSFMMREMTKSCFVKL